MAVRIFYCRTPAPEIGAIPGDRVVFDEDSLDMHVVRRVPPEDWGAVVANPRFAAGAFGGPSLFAPPERLQRQAQRRDRRQDRSA